MIVDKEEFHTEIARLKAEHEKAIKSLRHKYAMENSTIKVGDTVKDHIGSVVVESIKIATSFNGLPQCIYFGLELTKKGVPRKDGCKRGVLQYNLLTA
jgi:hypothetical protein